MPKEMWRKWKHITKLDPDKKLNPEIIEQITETDTDAIMISGTQNISKEKVKKVIDLLSPYSIPKVLEPANPFGVVHEGVDYIFVPSVFNTSDHTWINGMHKTWVKIDKNINWDIVIPEVYLILNPKCAAARVTKAIPLTKEEVVAAAVCAERYFKFPIIYIEYSGTYGDPEIVKAVSDNLESAHLIYGGGIKTSQQANEMSQWATVVVGNTIYEGGLRTFFDTMHGTLVREMMHIQEKLNKLKELKRKNGNSNFEK